MTTNITCPHCWYEYDYCNDEYFEQDETWEDAVHIIQRTNI